MIAAHGHIDAMASYALADALPPGAVSLAQNESAFPPSPRAVKAAQTALNDLALYPDPDWTALRHTICEVHGVPAEAVLCGAGSMELIGALIHAYAGPGRAVLGTAYGYLFVATACQQAQAPYRTVAEPQFTVSVDRLLQRITPDTKIVFLCNPGNPTGTRIANSEVLRLRASLPKDILLVIDQAYGEFDDQDHRPVFALAERGDTVILRTLSKAYGLAGARVGWGVFPHDVGEQVRKLLNPNNISGPAQAAAAAALRDQAYMTDAARQIAELREDSATALRSAGLPVPDSHTNFLLLPFDDVDQADRMDTALRSQGLHLRGMAGYGLPHCLRATIGPAEVMQRMVSCIVTQLQEIAR